MKIIAIVRSRNEERNVARFCMAYRDIADAIFIADGGSEDATVDIARRYPKVEVRTFEEDLDLPGGHHLNPPGKHTNFLIRWAEEEGATHLIFDDMDCTPNFTLRQEARAILADTDKPAVFVHRIYFWGFDKVFPAMHGATPDARKGIWTSLWAWNCRRITLRAQESDPYHLGWDLTKLSPLSLHVPLPHCLLHRSWQTPELVDAAVARYRASGIQPSAEHPLKFAGPMEDALWYMKEYDE